MIPAQSSTQKKDLRGKRVSSHHRSRRNRKGSGKKQYKEGISDLLHSVVDRLGRVVLIVFVFVLSFFMMGLLILNNLGATQQPEHIGMAVQGDESGEKSSIRIVTVGPQQDNPFITDITRELSLEIQKPLEASFLAGVIITEWWPHQVAPEPPQTVVADVLQRRAETGTVLNRIWWRWNRWVQDESKWSYQTVVYESLSRTAIEWRHPNRAQVCSIAIINTTETAGLATAVADVFTNTGLRVINVSNDRGDRSGSVLYAAEESRCRYSQQLTRPFWQQREVDGARAASARADLVLYLGADVAESYSKLVQ